MLFAWQKFASECNIAFERYHNYIISLYEQYILYVLVVIQVNKFVR